jgi:hypothetical protein
VLAFQVLHSPAQFASALRNESVFDLQRCKLAIKPSDTFFVERLCLFQCLQQRDGDRGVVIVAGEISDDLPLSSDVRVASPCKFRSLGEFITDAGFNVFEVHA